MKLLKLIRYENLIILAVAQLLFRYGFLELHDGLPLALNDWQYVLFVLASVLIAGGGFLMNAISGPDKHLQPVTEEQGYNYFMAFNLTGLGIGAYLSYHVGNMQFVTAFILGSAMLYIAVTNLRTTLFVPNILISLSVTLSILSIGIFNFYPYMGIEGSEWLKILFEVIVDYSVFTFIVLFIYTLVSDLKNMDTDYNSGKSTLAIVLGRDRAAKVVFFLTLVPLAMLLYYGNNYISEYMFALAYGLLFVAGPLIYFAIKLWTAKAKKDYIHLCNVLRVVLLFTAISILVITLSRQYNA